MVEHWSIILPGTVARLRNDDRYIAAEASLTRAGSLIAGSQHRVMLLSHERVRILTPVTIRYRIGDQSRIHLPVTVREVGQLLIFFERGFLIADVVQRL
ncbi:hypothetical protein B0E55_05962 [Rhodococcus sp. 66b]|nr:hypothetical protein B0E55_05962 [Rhodococcus sp. 66b]